ncbi:valine--tRNA ligase [Roseococcus sp.]|uniref:valine--tRNA ligase n=1 Tax=Roseococcus sp. TaxID=2109646 RepID=UPI003BAA3781
MLDKAFDPASMESRLYAASEASGAFGANPESNAQPFTIVVPPPNVTGSLHIGHALNNTLQDVLVRYRRMQGRDALWMPGMDHAGIATQMVVERLLGTQGKTRKELGREAFVNRIWDWKAESGGTITRQLRRLGASLDWPRERFTMDAGLSKAVIEVFVRLHKEGLIYRDTRLVNWDPVFQTAISDLEVESRETKGQIWTLRYPVEGEPGRYIQVATTRPETMLADTAIAVSPGDERFAGLVGKKAIVPLVGRAIPIVADEYSDPEKGTGAVKITPAHDFNDYNVGRRHDLPMPSVLDAEARIWLDEIDADLRAIEGVADPEFVRSLAGQDRFVARKAIVAELERLELFEGVEAHSNAVPHGDRSGVPIEPRLTLQWYCDAATLAKPAIEAVETGKMEFVPKQWENTFFAWMRDIQPWCISRQLWWGHRIPAWYGPEGSLFVEKDEESAKAAAREQFGRDVELTRDEDVLDTWFSSGLWPFSTLGWPDKTPELNKYYPTDVLVTGFDIIFFWVARMMMFGIHIMGEVPFKHVIIHGLVRDEKGAKMSKSKGNVLDPLELIDAYGADAVRFTLAALASPGRDIKLAKARMEGYRAFATKLWNASRFLEMNGIAANPAWSPDSAQGPLARWILDGANTAIAEATAALDAFRFDEYAAVLYRFTWNSFCDWFIEFAKPVLNGPDGPEKDEVKGAAQHVIGVVLRLLQPVMPFITEELWTHLGYGGEASLIVAPWPQAVAVRDAAEARAELDGVVRLISEVRAVRAEVNVPPSITTKLLVQGASPEMLARAGRWIDAIRRLARVTEIEVLDGTVPKGVVQCVFGEATLMLPLADVIDLGAERARLSKDRAKAEIEVKKINGKLGNPEFIAKAKEEVIEENRERLADAEAEIARLDAAMARIAG